MKPDGVDVMSKSAALIILHLAPLLLASTAFTIVTAPLGLTSLHWNYFDFTYGNGWGYVYHSDYTLAQILIYVLAYTSGLILYPRLTRPSLTATLAAIVCLAGLFSFGIELSHWVFDHHLCLIGSFPILLLPFAIWTIISLSLHRTKAVAMPAAYHESQTMQGGTATIPSLIHSPATDFRE